MLATVTNQQAVTGDLVNPDDYGQWISSQDPLTKQIVRKWEPYDSPQSPSNPIELDEIPCIARGVVDGGIRVAGTTERFGDTYENIDFVKLWIPSSVFLTKRDRVTNIRDAMTGKVIWLDEEYSSDSRPALPTIFNVNGVTPLFDAFGQHIENFVMLSRAETRAA